MTKRDIILTVAEKTNYKQRQVQRILEHCMDAISDALVKGEDVELRNFGVFEVLVRQTRMGRNPNQPSEPMVIPAHAVVKFRAGKAFRERLAKSDLIQSGKGRQ